MWPNTPASKGWLSVSIVLRMSWKSTSQFSFPHINCHQLYDPKLTEISMASYQPGFVAALKWRRRSGGETVGTVKAHANVQQSFDSSSWYLLQGPIIHSQLNRHSEAGSSSSRWWLQGSKLAAEITPTHIQNVNKHEIICERHKMAQQMARLKVLIFNILKELSLHAA